MDICTHMTDLLCHTAVSNMTLQGNESFKINFLKKIKMIRSRYWQDGLLLRTVREGLSQDSPGLVDSDLLCVSTSSPSVWRLSALISSFF